MVYTTKVTMKNPVKRVALLYPYFGERFPPYFHLWLLSASENKKIDFHLFTNIENSGLFFHPENVSFHQMSLAEFKKSAQDVVGFECSLERPYKICDYRPLFGLIFKDLLNGYDYWGYGDLDVILGDLYPFLEPGLEAKVGLLYGRGHLSVFRNDGRINNLILGNHERLKSVLTNHNNCSFDESDDGLSALVKQFDSNYGHFEDIADIAPEHSRLVNSGRENGFCRQVYIWDAGTLKWLFIKGNRIITKEIAYIHLQKRKMKVACDGAWSSSFWIVSNKFCPPKRKINVSTVKRYSHRNPFFWIHFRYLYVKCYILHLLAERKRRKTNSK